MPTLTFFNLPEEKRNNLIEAAMKEFSRVSLNEASINKIIQDAGISRGSFYMYFANKEELYFYILQEYKDLIYSNLKIYMDENKGDIIETYTDLFDFLVNVAINKENAKFIRNVFMNMTYRTTDFFLPKKDQKDMRMGLNEIIGMVDKEKLNASNDEELKDILAMVTILLCKSVMQIYITDFPRDKIREIYIRQLNILKKGIYINENKV